MKILTILIVSLLTFSGLSTHAAEFYRKQTGTTTIANGSTVTNVSISGVDMSQSFLVFSSTIDNALPENFQVGGRINNSTTLTFERTGNTGVVTIKWQVFEFEGGVFVQHGSATNIARNTNVNVSINCVDLTKSFVLISARKSGGQFGNDDGITANLTTSTNLQLFITGTAGANMEEAYWQVIEYQAATVKKVTATLNAGSTSTTSTITPAVSNLAKAFVVSNHGVSGDVSSDDLPRTELTNTTTVTYTRVGTTETMNFVTYVIEFTDQSTVTRGNQAFAAASVSQNVVIAAGASSGVFGPGNFGRQGSTSFATDDNPGHNWFTYEITSGTNLQIQRAVGTGSTANAPWQIVTFEDTGLQQNTFYSRASGAWEANTTWSFTPNGSSGAVPTGVYPRRSNNVVIQSGHTVTIDNVNDNGPCPLSPDGLGLPNVGPFISSNISMLYHTGDITIAGTLNVTGMEMMVSGYTRILPGGTFSLGSYLVNVGYLEADAASTLSMLDDFVITGSSTTIINTNATSADDIIVDHTNATLCGTGTATLQNGSGSSLTYTNGATVNQICTSFTINCTGVGCTGFPVVGTNPVILGNSGPGGVGSSTGTSALKLWFKSDNGLSVTGSSVDSWVNSAGISALDMSEAGAQRPTRVSNVLNGFSEVSFSGSNRLRTGLILTTSNFVNNQASSFVVARADNTTQTSSVYLTDPLEVNRFSNHIPWSGTVYYDIGNCCGNDARLDVGGLTGLTGYSIWTYDAEPTTGKQLYRNGTLLLSRANTSTYTSHATHRFNLGGNTTGSNGFQGDVTELVIFNSRVNMAQRILVDNYLSAKYNLPLTANDIYTMDDLGNGNFDFDVAGIGQASDGSNHKDSQGSSKVRIWNPSNLGNGEFLIWGNNSLNFSGGNTTDVDNVIIQERINRVWRVSEVGDVGTTTLSVNMSGILGSALGSNLRLLIDRDGDGFADNDVTPIAGSFSGGIVTFSGVNLQNGDRFTIGNTNFALPLPIQLISFDAIAQQSEVNLKWSTASELNNDFFTIQRSRDAESWQDVIKVKGAGTVNGRTDYETTDGLPFDGISYYRLKQTDYDKQYSFSPVRRVELTTEFQLKVYPNPSKGIFTVSTGFEIGLDNIRLFNLVGQVIPVQLQSDQTSTTLTSQSLASGIYILQVSKGNWRKSVRVIIE